MTDPVATAFAPFSDRELGLTRRIAAPPEFVWRAWTEPELLRRWFAPAPWTTPVAQLDLRPGGASLITMRGPDGTEVTSRGVYLEVLAPHRLVFTDAYLSAWEPSDKPFMTVTLGFEPEAGATRYTVRVGHWSVDDRQAHEAMGFHAGWAQCTDQLAALVASLT